MNISNYFYKLSRLLYYGTIVLVPIFFMTWNTSLFGMDTFNKQVVLWVLVFSLISFYLLAQIIKGKIEFKFYPADAVLFLLLFASAVSGFFGLDPYSSFFGRLNDPGFPVLTLLSLSALYFYIVQHHRDEIFFENTVRILFYIFIPALIFFSAIAFGLVEAGSLVSIVSSLMFGLRNDAGALIACFLILMSSLIIDEKKMSALIGSRAIRILLRSFYVLGVLILAGTASVISIWMFLLGNSFLIFLDIILSKDRRKIWLKRALSLSWLILLPLFLLFLGTGISETSTNFEESKRLRLDNHSAYAVTGKVISDHPLLGEGPETFRHSFSKYRDENLNNSEYWNIRFNRPQSFFLELSAATGLIGSCAYIIFLAIFLYLFRSLIRARAAVAGSKLPVAGLMSVWLPLAGITFFFAMNLTLWLVFFILSALLAGLYSGLAATGDRRSFLNMAADKDESRIAYISFSAGFFILLIAGILTMAAVSVYWQAEYIYKTAQSAPDIDRAADINPSRYQYSISAAKRFFSDAYERLPDESASADGLEAVFNRSVLLAAEARNRAPYSVIAQETYAKIMSDLSAYDQSASAKAAEAYRAAIALEPSNPILYYELGRILFDSGQAEASLGFLKEGYRLKNNYFPLAVLYAKVMSSNGESEPAKALLRSLAENTERYEVFYELGLIEYNEGEFKQAIEDFNEAVRLAPNHANSLYSLGLALEQEGSFAEALNMYSQVLELNPDNEEIAKKIEELRVLIKEGM